MVTTSGELTPRRAPSSPRHARGLNVSEFPRTCTGAQEAWLLGCWGKMRGQVFCESLQGPGKTQLCESSLRQFSGSISKKGNFGNQSPETHLHSA